MADFTAILEFLARSGPEEKKCFTQAILVQITCGKFLIGWQSSPNQEEILFRQNQVRQGDRICGASAKRVPVRQRQKEMEGGREGDRKYVTWCFTPGQPVRLYQGDEGDRERLNNNARSCLDSGVHCP